MNDVMKSADLAGRQQEINMRQRVSLFADRRRIKDLFGSIDFPVMTPLGMRSQMILPDQILHNY